MEVSPLYTAVMAWFPELSADVANTAAPDTRLTVPMAVAPSFTVTVPVADGGVTFMEKITLAPKAAGLSDDVSVMEVPP